MKKLIRLLLTVALTATLMMGCGQKETTEEPAEETVEAEAEAEAPAEEEAEAEAEAEAAPLHCAFILSQTLGSQSFNDVLWEGIVEGCEKYGYEYTALQGIEVAAQADALAVAIDEGVNMVFYANETEELVATGLAAAYPDVIWANIDSSGGDYVNSVPENGCVITYKEHEAAFLNGVFAAKLSKTGKVAQIQGADTGTMVRFNAGFRAGVLYELGEDPSTVAVGWADVNKAYETAVMLNDQGVDVFACCAAGSNLGVFQAAEEKGFLACGAAGGQFELMPSVIPASQVKTVDKVAVELIDAYVAGTFPYGEAQVRGIAEGGVDLKYTTANDELLASIPQEVFDYMDTIREKISNGEIVVPDTPEAVESFTARAE